jgi:plasmid stabilization system protein ParE
VRVVVAESAATDLYSLTVYFGQLNPSATDAMVDRILVAMRMLGDPSLRSG